MNWISRSTDYNGITTIYPPQPKDYNKIPKCSQCGGLTQFLHFFPEILMLLNEDEECPSFCSVICAKQFVKIIKQAKKNIFS